MIQAKPWAFFIQDQVTLGSPNKPSFCAKETQGSRAKQKKMGFKVLALGS